MLSCHSCCGCPPLQRTLLAGAHVGKYLRISVLSPADLWCKGLQTCAGSARKVGGLKNSPSYKIVTCPQPAGNL